MKFFSGFILILFSLLILQSCSSSRHNTSQGNSSSSSSSNSLPTEHVSTNNIPPKVINTKNILADTLVNFAETLQGVPYKYGSMKVEQGLDCSGFINYVFGHYKISVPRTSVAFTNAGTSVPLKQSRRGDLILFTGTDTTGWIVGHMGIITENRNGKVKFIHSASGNNKGVMISELSKYFAMRFVKVIRIFKA